MAFIGKKGLLMIVALIWLAGAVAMAYEITKHGYWQDGIAALSVLAFVLWVLGGSAAIASIRRTARAVRNKVPTP